MLGCCRSRSTPDQQDLILVHEEIHVAQFRSGETPTVDERELEAILVQYDVHHTYLNGRGFTEVGYANFCEFHNRKDEWSSLGKQGRISEGRRI